MPILLSRYATVVFISLSFLFGSSNASFADLDTCYPSNLTPEEAERDLPSKDEFVQKYVQIWKRIFIEKNFLSDSDFDKNIKIIRACGSGGPPSKAFNIHYYAKTEWFQALVTEQLTIYLPSTDDAYRYLNLRRDMYLSEEEIRILVERAHSPEIKIIDVKHPLAISNMGAAFAAINKVTEHKIFALGQQKPRCHISKDGDPIVSVFGSLDKKANKCLSGFVNVRTGEASVENTVCVIIN